MQIGVQNVNIVSRSYKPKKDLFHYMQYKSRKKIRK